MAPNVIRCVPQAFLERTAKTSVHHVKMVIFATASMGSAPTVILAGSEIGTNQYFVDALVLALVFGLYLCLISYSGINKLLCLYSCEVRCPNGTYGENCENDCSHCFNGECHFATGECLCDPGFYGTL